MIKPPREAEPALAAIRAAGGDELLHAMLSAFAGFAGVQLAWIERQFALRQFDGVADAARALRMSAAQVGALGMAHACERVELAGAGQDAAGVAETIEALAAELTAARAWIVS